MTTRYPRPTSPHLQIYRLPLTGIISITHRITGVLLCAGLVLVAVIFYALSQGADSYVAMQAFAHFWLVKAIYWGFIFALYFHLCHGVRLHCIARHCGHWRLDWELGIVG